MDVGLNAVIVAVTRGRPRVLTVRGPDPAHPGGDEVDLLPWGPLDPGGDRTLDLTLRGWVRDQTGLELGYVEQLYTFGDRGRVQGEPRTLSVAYLALVREGVAEAQPAAHWREIYAYLPWEDLREGRPSLLEGTILPRLDSWAEESREPRSLEERRERMAVAFGLRGSDWDGDRALERYELLYSAGLLSEAARDKGTDPAEGVPGRPMGSDHRRILATALGRIRGKIRYRPVVFELLPPTFTLLQLQQVVEALAGVGLHKQNFRRLVERGGLVEGTGRLDAGTGGRPAELFRFRREVLRERRAPGIGFSGG
jgi:hypothetical protein